MAKKLSYVHARAGDPLSLVHDGYRGPKFLEEKASAIDVARYLERNVRITYINQSGYPSIDIWLPGFRQSPQAKPESQKPNFLRIAVTTIPVEPGLDIVEGSAQLFNSPRHKAHLPYAVQPIRNLPPELIFAQAYLARRYRLSLSGRDDRFDFVVADVEKNSTNEHNIDLAIPYIRDIFSNLGQVLVSKTSVLQTSRTVHILEQPAEELAYT